MESLLAKEPFQGGSGVFQSGVRLDGRMAGQIKDSFGGEDDEYLNLQES